MSGLVKKSETLNLMLKLHGCANNILYAWSGSLSLES